MHILAMTPPPKYIGERWRAKDDHGRNIRIYHGRNIHIYHAPLVHAMMHAEGRESARTKGPKLSPPKLPLPRRRAHLRRLTSPPLPRCRTSLRRDIRPCHHTHPCRHSQPRRPQSRLPAPSSCFATCRRCDVGTQVGRADGGAVRDAHAGERVEEGAARAGRRRREGSASHPSPPGADI